MQVQVFGLTGKREATLFNGVLESGSHEFSLGKLQGGMYMVRVRTAQGAINQTVFVRD